MTVLVTGATGLLGTEVLQLIDGSLEACALTRFTPPPPRRNLTWIHHDLSVPQLPTTMPDSVDTVLHLAQSRNFRDFPRSAIDIFEVNVGSTARLLDWASRTGVRRFVYASSGGIYGHGDDHFREDDVIRSSNTLGYYLASKHSAELLVEAYGSEFIVVILRFFFMYGPGQRRSMLIPRLIDAVEQGTPIALQGPKGIRINPIYVSDAAKALKATLHIEENARINVAGPEVLTMRDIASTIGTEVGREPDFSVTDAEPAHLVGDITRMKEMLHIPEVSFSSGVTRTIKERELP